MVLCATSEGTPEALHTMVFTARHAHALTLRAQFTKSSSLVMTYSPLLLATAAGLAAATAVLFSLMGTTLRQRDGGRGSSPCAEGLQRASSSRRVLIGKLTSWTYSRS